MAIAASRSWEPAARRDALFRVTWSHSDEHPVHPVYARSTAELLDDADEEVREAAIRLLKKMGPGAVDGVIEEAHYGTPEGTKPMAIALLGDIGDSRAVSVLVATLKNPE